jgi:hypothetical protein
MSNYETLILGEDGESPIRPIIEKCLTQAKEDGVRLCIEIRTKPRGVRNSRSEHNLVVDRDNVSIETVMQVIIERLNESPGEPYDGEIRINFTQEGSPENRYASFTRQVTILEEIMNEDEILGTIPAANPFEDERLEKMMGLLFRSNAQMIAMFERSTRMMEGITMRYGAPPDGPKKHEKKLRKMKRKLKRATKKLRAAQASSRNSELGLLPMLLKAAEKLNVDLDLPPTTKE